MIDWNKRNGGFLSPESVYEEQLGNLSSQINEKDKEIDRLNNTIDKTLEELKKANVDHDEIRLCEIIGNAIFILERKEEVDYKL